MTELQKFQCVHCGERYTVVETCGESLASKASRLGELPQVNYQESYKACEEERKRLEGLLEKAKEFAFRVFNRFEGQLIGTYALELLEELEQGEPKE